MSNHGTTDRYRLRSRRGQGLVEFALVAPMLLLLIFGLVEFARAWNIRHVITDAAREGVRIMAVNAYAPPDSALKRITASMATAGLAYANATVTYDTVYSGTPECPTNGGAGAPAGGCSRVIIVYPYRLGIVGSLLHWAAPQRQLQIRGEFSMRNE